jgi:acyl-CoA thioester hydrolase
MKPPAIPVEKLLALEPACLRMTVPESYRDPNGHMNMRWYVAIFDDAGDDLHLRLGLTPDYHREHKTGTVDLEHHTHFMSEVLAGDRLAVYARVIAQSAKRVHYLMFMVNETRNRVAAIFECMNAFVDLTVRKTTAFPPEIASRITAAVEAGTRLDWPAPVSGTMQV